MAAQPTVRPPEGGPTVSLSVHTKIKNKLVPEKSYYAYGWRPIKAKLSDVVKHIAAGGAISVGYIRTDHRTSDNFVSSDIVGLDFDHNTSVADLQRDEFIHKYAFLIYATSSSTKEAPRSRALFRLDKSITSAEEYRHLVKTLLAKYSMDEVDEYCKDPVRIFYGSTKRDRAVNLEAVLPVSTIEAVAARQSIHVVKPNQGQDAGTELAQILNDGSRRGSRDNDAMRLVGALSNLVSSDVMEAIMRMWYDNRVLDKDDFSFDKIQDMVKRMSVKAAPIRSEVASLVRGKNDTSPLSTARAVSFVDFVNEEEEDITWAIDKWLPDHTTGLMVAPPGNYKTWLAMAMGMAVATGMPFCGAETRQGRVLLIQQEDSRNILRQRLKTIGAEVVKQYLRTISPNDLANPNLFTFLTSPAFDMYVSDSTLRLDNPKAMDNIRSLINVAKYDLIIIDPLYAMAETDDYMAKSAQKLVELKRIRDSYGTSFLILHHTKKTADSSTVNRLDIWGSQLLNAWLEVGIQIRPVSITNNKEVKVMRHFKSSGEVNSEILTFDISTSPDDRRFLIGTKSSVADAHVNNGEVDLVELIKNAGPMLTGAIAARAGVHPSTVSRKLKQLVDHGDLVRDEKTKLYSLPGMDISF